MRNSLETRPYIQYLVFCNDTISFKALFPDVNQYFGDLGFGLGGVDTITTIEHVTSNLETSVIEGFFHIGLPFWNTIEFHLGYHYMSVTKIDITSEKSIKFGGTYSTDKNYTGGMTTIGVQIAF